MTSDALEVRLDPVIRIAGCEVACIWPRPVARPLPTCNVRPYDHGDDFDNNAKPLQKGLTT